MTGKSLLTLCTERRRNAVTETLDFLVEMLLSKTYASQEHGRRSSAFSRQRGTGGTAELDPDGCYGPILSGYLDSRNIVTPPRRIYHWEPASQLFCGFKFHGIVREDVGYSYSLQEYVPPRP